MSTHTTYVITRIDILQAIVDEVVRLGDERLYEVTDAFERVLSTVDFVRILHGGLGGLDSPLLERLFFELRELSNHRQNYMIVSSYDESKWPFKWRQG